MWARAWTLCALSLLVALLILVGRFICPWDQNLLTGVPSDVVVKKSKSSVDPARVIERNERYKFRSAHGNWPYDYLVLTIDQDGSARVAKTEVVRRGPEQLQTVVWRRLELKTFDVEQASQFLDRLRQCSFFELEDEYTSTKAHQSSACIMVFRSGTIEKSSRRHAFLHRFANCAAE